jgi:hypothetical protein
VNRQQIIDLLMQTAGALSVEPHTPATWTEEDRAKLADIHAATVAQKRTAAAPVFTTGPVEKELPMFTSIPSADPPAEKKKSFWKKLGAGMKTAVVGVGAAAGGAALHAAVGSVMSGNLSPSGIATTAGAAAVAAAIGYRSQPPKKEE